MSFEEEQAKHEALVNAMRKNGVMPPKHDQRRELGLMVVCNACGSIVDASWVAVSGSRQMVVVVEKCKCDSPLLEPDRCTRQPWSCRYSDARQCAHDTMLGAECPKVCSCECHTKLDAG